MSDTPVFFAVIGIGIILLSCTVHEYAHGWVAYKLGDPTAYLEGRLTLNPISHIDPFFSILLPAVLYHSTGGAFVFGGARPVPINHLRFRNPTQGLALSSLAGPMANFGLALSGLAMAVVLKSSRPEEGSLNQFVIDRVLIPWYFTNILLGAFNLIPIPPLDGSRILRAFLHGESRRVYDSMERFGLFLLIGLMFFGLLNPVIEPVQEAAYQFMKMVFLHLT